MLPAQRRQVGQEVVRHTLCFAQGGHGPFEVAGVPKDDGRDQEVEAGRAVLLVLVGAVADLAQAVDEQYPSGRGRGGVWLGRGSGALGGFAPVPRQQFVQP